MTPTFGNATTRLSCIKFLPIVGSGFGNPININGTCTASGCPDLRIDNLTFPITWAQAAFSDQTVININNVFGVADHNTVGDGSPPSGHYLVLLNVGHSSWNGIGGWGDNSWASPDTFGSSRAFYLENNTFNYAQATDTDVVGYQLGGGGRIVCRFNNFASMYMFGGCTGHGTDTGGRMRGIRQWEIYDNTAVCPNGFGCGSFSPGRSGVGRNFENALSNSGTGFFKGIANLDAQRTWRANSPYGYCDGKSAWDQNDTNGGGGNNGFVYYTGTIGLVAAVAGSYVITDANGSLAWTTNQWATSGSSYSFYDVTQGIPFMIASNNSNFLTTQFNGGGNIPAAGDSYQILRVFVCMDQPTRGQGLLVQDTVPGNGIAVLASKGNPGSVAGALDPTYEAADILPNSTGVDHTISSQSLALIPNRDFYVEADANSAGGPSSGNAWINQSAQTSPTSPFNGSTCSPITPGYVCGTGHGTLANRPTSCTTGVGYWATDQGSWNTSSNLSTVTGQIAQGQLYICTSTNTWTLSYTPYTYPHLLIAGGTSGTTPNPPTGMAAVVQ